MHQIRFPLHGAPPQTPLWAKSAPPDLAVFKGPTSKGRERKERRRQGEGKGEIKEREGETK